MAPWLSAMALPTANGRTIAKLLKQVPIFGGFDDTELVYIGKIGRKFQFTELCVVTKQGQPAKGMFIVLQGNATAHRQFEDRYTQYMLQPGDYFGEEALLRQSNS